MARILDETFEGTGTVESWTPTGSPDPDVDTSTVSGAPSEWGSQCGRATTTGADHFWTHSFAAAEATCYTRVEFVLESLGTPQFGTYGSIADGWSGSATLFDASGTTQLAVTGDTGSGIVTLHTFTPLSTGVRYRLEVKWDTTAGEWEVRLDGTTGDSGTLSGASDQSLVRAGAIGPQGGYTVAVDLIAVDDADWVGAESSGPSSPTDLTVTSKTDTTVSLSWTDPNGGTANPRMYRRATPATAWVFVEELATTAETYTHTGLSQVEYDFGVAYRLP